MMKQFYREYWKAGAAVLLVVAFGLGVYVIASGDGAPQADPVIATGTLEADETTISAEVMGRVAEVLVTEGEEVATDQVLFKLDASELRARHQEALSTVHDAEAALALAMAGPRTEEIARARSAVAEAEYEVNRHLAGARPEEVLRAEGELKAAAAALEQARREHDRMKLLYTSAAVAQRDFEEAQAEYQAAEGHHQVAAQQLALITAGPRREETAGAQERLRQAQASYRILAAGTRAEEIAAFRARVEQARAALTMAEIRLADAEVKAPVTATVTGLVARKGEVVAPGEPLATVVTNTPWVDLYIEESQAGALAVGLPVEITVRSYPGSEFTGRVTSINETTVGEQQTKETMSLRTLRVRVRVEGDRQRPLRPGMSVQAAILRKRSR
jgi:HlyD family secretion protein